MGYPIWLLGPEKHATPLLLGLSKDILMSSCKSVGISFVTCCDACNWPKGAKGASGAVALALSGVHFSKCH
jgi:hypothetical protein